MFFLLKNVRLICCCYVCAIICTYRNKIQDEDVRVNRVVRNNVQLLGRLMHTTTISIDSEEGDLYILYFVLLPTTPLYFNFSTIHIC